MAKCVVCKAENASAEAKKHENPVTLATAAALWKRVKQVSRIEQPQRFCEKHNSTSATPILKEENSNGQTV